MWFDYNDILFKCNISHVSAQHILHEVILSLADICERCIHVENTVGGKSNATS